MDNTLIRFNWHHRYGTPRHLENIDCSSSYENFELWRNTINFDEVIDYCGARGWAKYRIEDENNELYGKGDFIIIKMNQRPIYKELHLGWTTQKNLTVGIWGELLKKYTFMGRKAYTPTYIYSNFKYFWNRPEGFSIEVRKIYDDDYSSFVGWTGSQLLYNPDTDIYNSEYSDQTKMLSAGMATGGTAIALRGPTYNRLFDLSYPCNVIGVSPLTPETENTLYKLFFDNYLSELETGNDGSSDFYWMPSNENKEKCPSDRNEECLFDIRDYMDCTHILVHSVNPHLFFQNHKATYTY